MGLFQCVIFYEYVCSYVFLFSILIGFDSLVDDSKIMNKGRPSKQFTTNLLNCVTKPICILFEANYMNDFVCEVLRLYNWFQH